MTYCQSKKIKCNGKWVGISISDNDRYYWIEFENEARKKKQTPSELFCRICEIKGINQKELFIGKVSSNIKKVLIDYYKKPL